MTADEDQPWPPDCTATRSAVERLAVATPPARLAAVLARLSGDGWPTPRIAGPDESGLLTVTAEREAAMPADRPDAPVADPPKPGSLLRAARVAAGLTGRDVASIAGVTPSYVSNVEADIKEIGSDVIYRLAVAIGVDPASIGPRAKHLTPAEIAAERAKLPGAGKPVTGDRRRKKGEGKESSDRD